MDQTNYINNIRPMEIGRERRDDDCLTSEEMTLYRGIIGKFNWDQKMTRPDIGFNTLELSKSNKKPTIKYAKERTRPNVQLCANHV